MSGSGITPAGPIPRAKGFTLVEIMVVVAIIALLISILIPSLRAARETARISACAANLRTIAQCTLYYAKASADEMPAGYLTNADGTIYLDSQKRPRLSLNPWEFLQRYTQKVAPVKGGRIDGDPDGFRLEIPVYSCPSDRRPHTTNQRFFKGLKDVELWLSYNANAQALLSNPADEPQSERKLPAQKMSVIQRPSSVTTYFDGGDDAAGHDDGPGAGTGGLKYANWDPHDSTIDPPPGRWNQITFELHHNLGGNFAYVDSHVDLLKKNGNKTGPYQYGLPPYPSAFVPNHERYDPNDPRYTRYVTTGFRVAPGSN